MLPIVSRAILLYVHRRRYPAVCANTVDPITQEDVADIATPMNLYFGNARAFVCIDAVAAGTGLGALKAALDDLKNDMAIMGARMLEEQKKAAEAADTVKMRYSGDTATLASIVTSAEQGVTKMIDLLGVWMGIENDVQTKVSPIITKY